MDRLVEPAPAAVTAPPEEHKFKGQAWIRSAPPSDELFAYPRNGQSEEQQRKDGGDCQQWAAAQTGFAPHSSENLVEKRNEYFRAQVACLEARGYSVR